MMDPQKRQELNSASVLLSFAVGVDFTPTDPLLCMVRTGAGLLSYDRLSVGRFPDVGKDEERAGYIRGKIADLRNVLEDRCLSSEDKGGRIRIILLLDFKPWGFMFSGASTDDIEFDTSFPSLKIDFLKSTVEEVFGCGNPLLKRFDYLVIFLDDASDETCTFRYRNVAFHGYYDGLTRNDWISSGVLHIDGIRDEVLDKMGTPDASASLNGQSLQPAYRGFLSQLNTVLGPIKGFLERVGKEDAFSKKIAVLNNVKTVKDFQDQPYDAVIRHAITESCGLGAGRFRDFTFLFMTLDPTYVARKTRDTLSLKSLIQLLCTIDEEQFKKCFKPAGPMDSQKLFILEDAEIDHARELQLSDYARDIESLESHVTGMWWDSDKEVAYTAYAPPKEDTEGSHKDRNEEINDRGNQNEKDFRKVRRVPFFFGKKPGDWKWYRMVMDALNKCLSFEDENDRPLVDRLTRLDDDILDKSTVKTNFGELGTAIENTAPADIVSHVDYDKYIRDRKDNLSKLGDQSRALSKELVRLGVRSRMLWMAVLACLAVTLCYAFHFFSDMAGDHPLWIAAGFLAVCLLMTIGAIIAQVIVKGKIRSVYKEIDALLDSLRKLAKEHLKSINDLAKAMNEADALRKTLFEMKSKYNEWNLHNKKVENWRSFAQDITSWLNTLFADMGMDIRQGNDGHQTDLGINDTLLESKPSVVTQIRSKYKDMKPELTVTNNNLKITIEGVTCFVSQFMLKCIQDTGLTH